MKKIFISILALSSIMLLMLSSCKKDETKAYSSLGSTGTLTASTTAPALSLETAANTAVTFSFPETSVSGTKAVVTYTLQVDKKGNNFTRPTEIAAAVPSTVITVDALNTALHNLGLADGVETQVEIRVKSAIAANADATYSNALTLTVTPYSKTSYLYLPGSYQGWNPASDDIQTISSPTSNKIYDGEVTFTSNDATVLFKFTTGKTWDENYGGVAGKLIAGGDTNIPVAPGKYKIHVDLNTMSYTIDKL
ncbi:SusE domain-containing protein [Mucilaginibacter sp. Bleaf8]|uniref:SusE domain-containing protein n=1 Tax=Mucilaginibacter sp. Bleaf8 TaxID=2834430 RepID=UPI001BCB25FA|nr:SusE domain-containing protein [Mucilaginibacter sp. Bleaf8]MBS7563748.1 SusE domain-containing protein [Mucilaginibacter sp. Bleaf8]